MLSLLLPDIDFNEVLEDVQKSQIFFEEVKPYFLWRTKKSLDRKIIFETDNYRFNYSTKKHDDGVETEGITIIPLSYGTKRSVIFLGYDDQKITYIKLMRPLRVYASGDRNGEVYEEIPTDWKLSCNEIISKLRKEIK